MHSGIGNPCGLGCPIRTFLDHSSFTSSPGLFAGDRVLHRLLTPRHPPCALRPDRTNRTPRPLPPKSGVPPRQPPGETRPRLCWPNQAQTTSQALVAIFATLTVLPHLDKEHGPSPHRPSPAPACAGTRFRPVGADVSSYPDVKEAAGPWDIPYPGIPPLRGSVNPGA